MSDEHGCLVFLAVAGDEMVGFSSFEEDAVQVLFEAVFVGLGGELLVFGVLWGLAVEEVLCRVFVGFEVLVCSNVVGVGRLFTRRED